MKSINITECISLLLNKQFNTPDEVEQIITSIHGPQLIPSLILSSNQYIYRARVINNIKEIVNNNSLSYLPPEKNNSYKRASTPANTMFYGISSDEQWSSVYGCCAETCDCFRNPRDKSMRYNVVIGQWQTTIDLKFAQIINPNGSNKSESFKNDKEYRKIASSVGLQSTDSMALMKYLNHEFTKIVENNDDKGYWVSAILSKLLLKTGLYDGIIYESVQSFAPGAENVHCVAILPSVVDKHMVFRKAESLEIEFSNYNQDASIISVKIIL